MIIAESEHEDSPEYTSTYPHMHSLNRHISPTYQSDWIGWDAFLMKLRVEEREDLDIKRERANQEREI